MITDLQIFSNSEFGSVRATEINGEAWFVGKDIAEKLGYVDTNKAIAMHVDSDDKLNDKTASSLGQRGGWLINESGVYSLILRSNLPKAKEFKHWITSEVLPSIRKHGAYMTPETLKKVISDPDFIIGIVSELKAEQERRKLAEGVIAEQEQKLIAEHPKVIFADAVSASDSLILVRDLAKMIKQNGIEIGEKRLWKWLRENGYICKGSCTPTQKSMEMKLFAITEYSVNTGDGNPIAKLTTKVTGKGQQYFVNKFLGDLLI